MLRLARHAPGLLLLAAAAAAQTPAQKEATKEVSGLFKQADALAKKHNHAEAKRLLQQALKKAESAAGPSSKLAATAALRLGRAHLNLFEFSKAESLCGRSLKVREEKLGKEHLAVAEALAGLGDVYVHMGDYARARTRLERALRLREKHLAQEPLLVAASLHDLGSLYGRMGRHADAEPLLRRALSLREEKRGKDHPDVAETLNALGLLYRDLGQYAKAEEHLLRSERIHAEKDGQDGAAVAAVRNNLALLYAQLGQRPKAERLYLQSLQAREEKLGKDHPDVAESCNNLGLLYPRMGKQRRAEELFRRAIGIYEKKLGEGHPSLASPLNNLATLLRLQGRVKEALPPTRRALGIREAKLGKDHPLTASALTTVGALCYELGQYHEAEQMHRRALGIYKKRLGDRHPLVAGSSNDLAVAYQLTGQDDKAAESFDQSRRVQRHHLTRVLPALAEREQLTLLRRAAHVTNPVGLSFGLARKGDAGVAELSAGWLLNAKGIPGEVLSVSSLLSRDSGETELGKLAKELRAAREQLARLIVAPAQDGEHAAHVKKVASLTAREQKLARTYRDRAGLGSVIDEWVEIGDVRKGLRDGAVLIDVARFPVFDPAAPRTKRFQPDHYAAWVTPAQGRVQVVDLGPADAIDEAVRAVRRELQKAPAEIIQKGEPDAEKALRGPLEKLSGRVLAPLLQHVGQASRWVVSPDGSLWLVPWEMLLLPDGKYAVEKHTITYVLSGRDAIPPPKFAGKVGQAAVFADPDFNLEPKGAKAPGKPPERPAVSSLLRLGAVKRLPGTLAEAKGIEPSLRDYTKQKPAQYLGEKAREEAVKSLKNPRVLVLSTHGFFLPADEAKRQEERLPPGAENPLLRCGLLLAGCNKAARAAGGDDGVLTGLEVASLDLRGCEMVVLSACETGIGDVRNGEGVAGLRQAFRLAGAESVVSTLWQVPDGPSAELMTLFFRNLAKGGDHAQALRQARLRMLKQRSEEKGAAHPFFWAAFTLTGR